MSEKATSGKTIVGEKILSDVPHVVVQPPQEWWQLVAPLDSEAITRRRAAKAEMFARKMADSAFVLDEMHPLQNVKLQNSNLSGAHDPGLKAMTALIDPSTKLETIQTRFTGWPTDLPPLSEEAQTFVDQTVSELLNEKGLSPGNELGISFFLHGDPRTQIDRPRVYRNLYHRASRRKKLYLKRISATHTLEECIKHARHIRF